MSGWHTNCIQPAISQPRLQNTTEILVATNPSHPNAEETFMASGEKIIGIDLGTTNSVVAVMEGTEVKVIPNAEGNRLTPSVVAFTDKSETIVGEPARRQAVTNPRRTISSVKRFMGRRHSEVESEEKIVPYQIVGGANEYVKVQIGDQQFTPQEISAKVLRKLKEAAESYLGHRVSKAVITVPAYFNDAQRQATKDAGQIAGLEVARIINEPTAAALAYGLDKTKDQKIIVFDLGGGTFDVSVLEVAMSNDDENNSKVFEVISTSGDTHLGGDDFDQALVNHVANQFLKDNGLDLRKEPMSLQRLQEACEKAKKELSSLPQTDINLPFITADATGPKHLQMTITRSTFEGLVDDLIERCRKPVLQALQDAKMKPSEIDEVVLVGGSTRVPKVRQLVKDIFGKEPHQGVNPDEVVAVGAAIQGAVLSGDRRDVLLLDVTPLTLGIETEGGVLTALIERNTTIPVEKKQTFSTAADGQTAVTVSVFQGERKMAQQNRLLDQFNLEGIDAQARGVPQIEVKFDIDQNGILNVSAKDLKSGKQSSVKIEQSSGLSKDEIERMRREAETHADEDRKFVETAEAKNRAENTIHGLEKAIKEQGEKLSESDREPLEQAIKKARDAITTNDAAAIKAATMELDQSAQAFRSTLGAQSGPSPAGEPAKSPSDDDAIDAEFEVKK